MSTHRVQKYKGTSGRPAVPGLGPKNRIRELLNEACLTEAVAGAAIWPGTGTGQTQLNLIKNRRRVPTWPVAWRIVLGLRVAMGRPDLRFEDVFPPPAGMVVGCATEKEEAA